MSYSNRFVGAKAGKADNGGENESKRVSSQPGRPAVDFGDIKVLFPIPSPPQLSKVSEPKPVSRIAPGYDMRTLRKQVDQLNREILDRVDNQSQLYSQNERLWNYMKLLLESNKSNAVKLHDYMGALQEELQSVQKERAVLAERLRAGQALRKVSPSPPRQPIF